MTHDTEASIITNDLDSMRARIESLPGHPRYTDALNLVTQAKCAVQEARISLHQSEMRERFAKMDKRA